MALETDLNVSPYFDDFDSKKDFYKVLFQPGVAVQARELNQLQSILQHQIEKFGDNVFKRGTIIDGCTITKHDKVPYIKINDLTTDGLQIDISLYNNLYVKNASNVEAYIVKTTPGLQSRSPDLNTLFVNYISSGDDFETDSFAADETLTVFNKSYPIFNIKVNDGASKFGNSDTVVVMSALALQNSTGGAANASNFASGTVIQNGVANAVIIEANITANSTALILKVRPEYSDLQTANTIKFRFAAGESVRNFTSGATANVVAIVGSGAVGSITTDSLGKVTAIQVVGQGSGYYVEPHVTIANNSTTSTFSATELGELELAAETFLATIQVANATAVPIGTGYGVTIGEGTIYQKGFFSRVASQFEVVNKYSNTGFDKSVGFYTNESIVNSNQDQTLLDNATGTFNFAAPGADRLKLTPIIDVLTKAEADANSEFLPIIEFTDGRPYRVNQDTVFNVIGRQLAERTFEESGNYVIDQFLTLTKDSGTFSDTSSLVKMNIDPGKAYINGIRIETIDNYKQNMNKGTTKLNDPASQTRLGYGNYYEVDELAGSFNFDIGGQVDLYGSPTNYISSGASTITPAGSKIGTARLRTFAWQSGDVGNANAVYRMYLFDIKMNAGKNTKDVRSIYYDSGNKAIADIVLDPTLGVAVLQDTLDSSLLFKLKNATSNVSNITYQYRTINTSETSNTTGYVVLNLPSNEFFPYTEELNTSEKRDLIVIPNGNFKSQAPATGTISTANNTTTEVVGSGSLFAAQFSPGDFVFLANSTGGNTSSAQIASIANSTSMTLATAPGKTYSGGSITLYYPQNIPISLTNKASKFANVDSSNSQIMTIFLGNTVANATSNAAASMPVSVVYNAQRNNVSSAAKTSNRGNYARIRIANNNSAGIRGPWPLGVSDAYRLRGVWKKDATAQDITFNVSTDIVNSGTANAFITVTNNPFANGDSLVYSNTAGVGVLGGLTNGTTYFAVFANTSGLALSATRGGANLTLTSNSSSAHKFTGNTEFFTEDTFGVTDVTNQFYIDSRQNEDFLDISHLARKPRFDPLAVNDILLVKFDAFESASGVKTISSYTINDSANLASLVADASINTLELAEFEGRTGIYYDVRDCIDLRPAAANTINYVKDIANTAAGANAASIINPILPSNTNYFSSASAFFPVPNSTLSANVSSYLGRIDRVIINSNGGFEIRTGESAVNPVVPPSQDSSLTLQIYNIPPYPSLPEVLSNEMIAISDTKLLSAISGKRKINYTIKPAIGRAERSRIQQRRYTMSDIGSLDRRIKDLEYYVSFTLAEALAKARFIPSSLDAALDRFKFGFFVDPFTDYVYADRGNPEFYSTIRSDQLGPYLNELNLQFMPDGNGQEDGILTLPYIEFVIGEQSAATAGPLPTVVVDTTTTTTTTTPTPTPTPVANTTGDVTLATVTQRIESAVERERSTSVSDDGSVFEEFTYRFSSLSGPAELYVVSRDNTLSATVYQGSSQNGPFTATQTSSSAAGITNADIARIYQINQLNDGRGVEHPGSLERKSYPNNIDSGTFLEDQFKITWTHDPAAGQFVKIRIYKGKKRGGLFGGQGRTGTYGYFLQYPTDTVTTEVRTVSNPNTFEYTGVVHSVNPNSFTITNSMNYYFDFYAVGDYFYLADSQKFVISMSGLKPNTNHTFTFDGEDRTSKCSQIRTSTTNSSGLRSDENGILTFDFYYDAGLDEAATDIEAQNRIIANIAGQKRFVVENNDGTSRAAGQITLAYYSNIIPNNADYLNVTPSTTSTSVTEQESFIPSTSGGSGTPDVIDTSVDPAGTYNVQRLDFRNFESQINFRIP
jgi:hypothetical protein